MEVGWGSNERPEPRIDPPMKFQPNFGKHTVTVYTIGVSDTGIVLLFISLITKVS